MAKHWKVETSAGYVWLCTGSTPEEAMAQANAYAARNCYPCTAVSAKPA